MMPAFIIDISVDGKSDICNPKDLYHLSMINSFPVVYIVSGDKDLTAPRNMPASPS
jgi:hypothetical protein